MFLTVYRDPEEKIETVEVVKLVALGIDSVALTHFLYFEFLLDQEVRLRQVFLAKSESNPKNTATDDAGCYKWR